VDSLERQARHHQARLVEALQERGRADEAVLRAFAAVPRHRFADRFWAIPPGAASQNPDLMREWVVGRDDDALELVYAPDTALVTAGLPDQRVATSSVSAPDLVAGMLAELDLAPGMRVLEIGAGSGYHAALMAELVGDPALVTTVDIDPGLVGATRRRLDALGLAALSVVCADGDDGYAAGAPYDRVVATVGCADLAPAWVDQLGPGGTILAPLVHGAAHPRVRVRRSSAEGTVEGRYVGHSGFVDIQGVQGGRSPWAPLRRPGPPPPGATTVPLPGAVHDAVAAPDRGRPRWTPAAWALSLYVALRDPRAGFGASLADGGASASIEGGRMVLIGEAGDLGADLLVLARDWLALGAPGFDRYATAFARQPAASARPHLTGPSVTGGPWHVVRLRHHQTVTLAPPA
jgi:protein-L-isoaspartate(D-aspartate) O-methyltransferase